MSRRKDNHVRQYGDFQTPPQLADQVCARLRLMGVKLSAILEPTCGRDAFLTAAIEAFPGVKKIIGVDINAQYVAEACGVCGGRVQVKQEEFFRTDWPRILGRGVGNWLVLGNLPWVANIAPPPGCASMSALAPLLAIIVVRGVKNLPPASL